MPTTSPSDEQRWLLALPAILTERNKLSHDELGGARRPIGTRKAVGVLARWWDVYTPSDVATTLRGLFDNDGDDALLGWELGRLAAVVGWGYGAYLLDLETAWSWLLRAGARAQAAYSSRADYDASYLRGLQAWAGADAAPYADAVAARDAMYARPDSAVNLPWRLDVANAPVPDATLATVEIAAGESINEAIARAGDGGRVVIGAGQYRESVRVPFALELVAAEPGRVAIEGLPGENALAVRVARSVRVAGLQLRSVIGEGGKTVNAVHVAKGCMHLEHCELVGIHHGLGLVGDGDVHLIGCHVHDAGKTGVYVEDGCLVMVDTRVERSTNSGVWRAKGARNTVLDNVDVVGGETSVALSGIASVRRSRISGAKTCGLLVDGQIEVTHSDIGAINVAAGGSLTLVGGTVTGALQVGGTARVIGTAFEGPAELGVIASGEAARIVMRDVELRGYTRANVFASQAARIVGDNCRLHGARVGAWSHGAFIRLSHSTVDCAEVTGIQLDGATPGVFVDCTIAQSGGEGIAIDEASTGARFSRCTIAACAGPARWFGAGARGLFEDCTIEGAAKPDDVAEGAAATIVDGGVLDARSLVDDHGDHVVVALAGNSALAWWLEGRGDVGHDVLGRALMIACADVAGDAAIDYAIRDGRFVAESSSPAELARAKAALIATLGDGRALRTVVDRAESVELFDGDD